MMTKIKYRNLPMLLSQMRESVISHFRPILNHFGLTEQQWRILRVLSDRGKMEPNEICLTCQILSPSMAGILKRLEEIALIQRANVPKDKRRVSISLTSKGHKLITEMAPLVRQQYEFLEEAYGKTRIVELYQVLDWFMSQKTRKVQRIELPEGQKR